MFANFLHVDTPPHGAFKVVGMDPLHVLAADPELAALLREAQEAIAAVHRRPVNLRRAEVTGSESVLRGARTSARMWRLDEAKLIDGYALLAPSMADVTVRTFQRAPAQIFARLDVLLGGDGVPHHPARLATLARLIAHPDAHPGLLPAVVHGELAAWGCFGERSGAVAWAAARIAALMGWDPRGLCVPEPYWFRHREEYEAALAGYPSDPNPFLIIHARAWIAGAAEADGIALAASPSKRG